jgi:hypothetical protein
MRTFPLLIGVCVVARTAAAEPPSCVQNLEDAKQDLIDNGFAPTSDHDTEKWLLVDGDATEASMQLEMGGADSAHIGYWLTVEKGTPIKKAVDWHVSKHLVCCDDNHEKSDNVIRFTWEKKTNSGFTATIVLDRFGGFLEESQNEANLFVAAAKAAAEACIR